MSLTSKKIATMALIRIGAYKGLPSEIATNYANAAFTDFQTESFPLQALYDNILGVEQEMAQAIAMNQDNTLRANISDTVTVTSGDEIPSFGSSSSTAKIIGVWGQVRDANSSKLLVPALREEEIRILVDNPGGMFKSSFFAYALRPPRIYSTVAEMEIDCCVYDYDARKTAIDANQELLFPFAENAYFHGLMAQLKNEDATLTGLSDQFTGAYAEWLGAQRAYRNVSDEAAA
jgi:hypothetical protein